MALDTRYVVAYHHCRRCLLGDCSRPRGPMDSATTGFSGPLLFAHLLSNNSSRSLICRRSRTLLLANDIRRSWGLFFGWYYQIRSELLHSGIIEDGVLDPVFLKTGTSSKSPLCPQRIRIRKLINGESYMHPKFILGCSRASSLKRRATMPEKIMIEALTKAGYWFKFQAFFYADGILYLPDFRLATKQKKLIVEIDGPSHSQQQDYDKRRTVWLETNRNCVVVRVTNDEVLHDAQRIVEYLALHEPKKLGDHGCPMSDVERAKLIAKEQLAEDCDPAIQFQRFT